MQIMMSFIKLRMYVMYKITALFVNHEGDLFHHALLMPGWGAVTLGEGCARLGLAVMKSDQYKYQQASSPAKLLASLLMPHFI